LPHFNLTFISAPVKITTPPTDEELGMKLGKLAVWSSTDTFTASAAAEFAHKVESWGYSALWLPEAVGRNVLVHASWLLAKTSRLIVATGIANIYARDAMAMASARIALNEQSGGRFLLGAGVSHSYFVEGMRGHEYGKPVATMRAYLEAMNSAYCIAPKPAEPPRTVIAALGPRMLELAASHADGAHPYNVTPEHTAQARAILGPDKWLCPDQKVLLESNPGKARAAARKTLGIYLTLPNYRNNWLRQGFTEEDLAGEGSDRFIDAMVAWGDEHAIRERLQQHLDAGADQVCINSLRPDGVMAPDERVLEMLAPGRM
jgi:probable F420-dependent oxidoreductase